jgi:parvulin-like peptidyl-prolyl isomerase
LDTAPSFTPVQQQETIVKRVIGAALILSMAGGCTTGKSTAPTSLAPATVDHPVLVAEVGSDAAVAHVGGKAISRAEFEKNLIEAYGLKILLPQISLSLARQKAEEQHIQYTQADVDAESQRTLKQAFGNAPREDYPALLQQLLDRKGVSRVEFDLVVQTNAILRKIAEPQVDLQIKDKLTDARLKEAFNALYGEKVTLRHIQCANPQEAAQVLARLAAGEKFETLVQTMSRNQVTAAQGGELPPFTRQSVYWSETNKGKIPQSFKDWAFNAKVGDISDTIQAENSYHILRLDRKTEPKVVKFEDEKEHLRSDLKEQAIQEGVTVLRGQLNQMARESMKIDDPILKKQFEDRQAEARKAAAAQAEERARAAILSHARPATGPSNPFHSDLKGPSGTPAGGAGSSPAKAPAGEQPPATKSAAPPAADTKAPVPNK